MSFGNDSDFDANSSNSENDEAFAFFNKKFSFKKSLKYRLPVAEDLFTFKGREYSRLQELKMRLNSVKSSLDNYPLEKWSEHTRKRNLAGDICWRLKTLIRAEFVTNAWCKFYEILHQYPIVKTGEINSVHLCEAPGAFIAALNHYLQSTYPKTVKWKWLSTTLNPYYEGNPLSSMIIDDRFMLHTLDNWVFGEDSTGNIMNTANIEYIGQYAEHKIGNVDLVTADGSIDCMETPGDQEQVVSALHYFETMAAIRLLSHGGCFVLKMFTFFENCSVNLLYFLNCVFETVNVFKPGNSKAGNSEVYVVCINFVGDEDDNFDDCFNAMANIECDKIELSIFPDIPEEFINDLVDCAEFFMDHQIQVIENNILHFERNIYYEVKKCKQNRIRYADYYVYNYYLDRIPENKKILNDKTKKVDQSINSRICTGSYAERKLKKNLSNVEKLKLLKNELDKLCTFFNQDIHLEVCNNSKPKTNIIYGEPIQQIRSSLFIDSIILQHLIKIIETDGLSIPTKFVATCSIQINGDHKEEEISKIDVDNFFLLSANFNQAERNFFCVILDYIISKQPDMLIFRNVPFLTHFSMSISFFLWSKIYENLTINQDLTITFQKLRSNLEMLNITNRITFKSSEYNEIISFIEIPFLHNNRLSSSFAIYNNKLCRDYGEILLNL